MSHTHAELCTIAASFLRRRKRCHSAIAEPPIGPGELPDAYGWDMWGTTHVIEVKISRADFNSDKYKPWRREPATALGDLRWYMAPSGLLHPDDMPPDWGLLSVSETGRVTEVAAARQWGTHLLDESLTMRDHQAKETRACRRDLCAVGYIANRLAKWNDLDPKTLRFSSIRKKREARRVALASTTPNAVD